MKLFNSARLKLTGWYLLIITAISFSFSAVIYLRVSEELRIGFHRAAMLQLAQQLEIRLPRRLPRNLAQLDSRLKAESISPHCEEDLAAAKKRLVLNLGLINGIILIVSGAAGYFLAGKTLKPIEKAMEEQKRFVADASHELRTPLTALKTSMEVALRDGNLSLDGARKTICSNLEDVNSLQKLSDNLLNLMHYRGNGEKLNFQKVGVAKVIKQAHRRILPLAKEKGVQIKLEVGDCTIWGNVGSLEEMILIFLDNAVKYTPPEGQVTVRTREAKRSLVIEIADTGIGIDEKDLPHIFDRFYRADQSRSKDKVDGFGLGLSLAKRIIELHHGSVEVKGAPGEGSIFTIKIPLV